MYTSPPGKSGRPGRRGTLQCLRCSKHKRGSRVRVTFISSTLIAGKMYHGSFGSYRAVRPL